MDNPDFNAVKLYYHGYFLDDTAMLVIVAPYVPLVGALDLI